MARADHRKRRHKETAQLDRLLEKLAQNRLAEQRELPLRESEPLPDSLVEYLDHVYIPHIDRPDELVAGVTSVQLKFLDESTVFAWDEHGRRQAGSVIDAKARRVFISSLVLRAISYCAIRWRGTEWYTICQNASTKAKFEAYFNQVIRGIDEPSWRQGWRFRQGRFEYLHQRGTGGAETDVVSTYEILLAGKSTDEARSLGRGRRMDGCHATEVPLYRYPNLVFEAIAPSIPNESGWLIAESTFGGDGGWFDRRWQEAKEGRGMFLAALFHPWFDDVLKRIPADDPRHERAMAIPVDKEDLEAEQAHGLDRGQIAFRRWWRCQGDHDARRAAALEYPETPDEALPVVDAGWLPAAALEVQEERFVKAPLLRVPMAPDLWASAWERAPQTLVLGLIRHHDRGESRLSGVGLDAETLEQVCEINGSASDGQVAAGLALLLFELGLLKSSNYKLVVGLPDGKTLVESLRRAERNVSVTPGTPRRGDWSRLPPGDLELSWAFEPHLWGPRRGEGSGAIGWNTTGYSRSTMYADRLRPAVTDEATPLRLRSKWLLRELRGLVLSKRTGLVEGRPFDALSRSLALAILAAPDVKRRTIDLSGLRSRAAVARSHDRRRPGRPSLPT